MSKVRKLLVTLLAVLMLVTVVAPAALASYHGAPQVLTRTVSGQREASGWIMSNHHNRHRPWVRISRPGMTASNTSAPFGTGVREAQTAWVPCTGVTWTREGGIHWG